MSEVLSRLVERQAERSSAALAVCDDTGSLSYGELNERSNQLARLLGDLGAAPGERVGLFLDKSVEAVVAIYGILKTGAAYVPIDPRSPAGRARLIAEGAGLRTVVSARPQSGVWPDLVNAGVEHVVVPERSWIEPHEMPAGLVLHGADEVARHPADPVYGGAGPDDLAYILFTSGSTGVPKGVMLTHRNALAFIDWAVDEFGIEPQDRMASVAPFHFDLSVFDLFAAAAVGASVHLVPSAAAAFPTQLARFARDHRITVWYSVPSALTLLVERGGLAERGLPDLHTVLFAGEVFPVKHLRRLMELLPRARYANLYGPTETNVCTFYRVDEPPSPGGHNLPIGIPISGVTCHVVRDDGTLSEQGEVGELWVRGPVVMQGYWSDPVKTAASLVPDPTGDTADLCYRTGDLVIRDAAGQLQLIGRRDHQIKSRGYRIELGEIETALHAHPAVAECAVVAVPDDRITNRIEAFVVTGSGIDSQSLLAHCRELLPSYMVPHRLSVLDELPRTSTGKVDRNTLASER